jgi:hypothetical protein
MQVKTSKKAWISLFFFGGIWTFQWVTAEKNKKLPPPNLASQVVGARELMPIFSPSFAASEADTPGAKIV